MKQSTALKLKSTNKALSTIGILALTSGVAMAATSNQGDTSFGKLFDQFKQWFQGNLGKLLALLGFAGTFVVYMMTHRGSILFVGIIISLLAGGLIGISGAFFDAGKGAFNPSTSS